MVYTFTFYDESAASAPPERIFTGNRDDLRRAGSSPRVRAFVARLMAEVPAVADLTYEDESEGLGGQYFVLQLRHDPTFLDRVLDVAASCGVTVYDAQADLDDEDPDWAGPGPLGGDESASD